LVKLWDVFLKRFYNRSKNPATLDVLTGYAHWAENYPAKAHNPLMGIEERAMLSLLPDDLSDQHCLDLACGSGRYLLLMQARRARHLVGSDYSTHMLAQAKATNEAFELARSPFLPLPFAAETFDLITCGLAVGHDPNLKGAIAEAARLLRPGGLLIYSDFHPFATMAGWERSFTGKNGTTFKLEHYLHLYTDHQHACRQAGLVIDAVLEPRAGEHAPAGFQDWPVVLVIRAVKAAE
jgi:malonyl-CoA O-methyltransferase